jgi:hypothetical protein
LDPATLMMNVPVDVSAPTEETNLTAGASAENAKDVEPTCHQTVTLTESFPLETCASLATTHVSEIQVRSEVAVWPWAATRLFRCEEYPKYEPKVVIEVAPVTGAFEGDLPEKTTGCK